jgi:hypothetical protein
LASRDSPAVRWPQPRIRATRSRAGQDDRRAAVGDLAAVGAAQPALDDRVDGVVLREGRVGQGPAAGLRERVAPRVAEVLAADRDEVAAIEAPALGVGVADAGEHARPQVAGALALVAGPRRGAEVARGHLAGDVALLLDAEDEGELVAPGLEVGHRGEDRDRARGARGLVARRGHAPQRRPRGRRHRPELALAGEQLAEGVADVDHAGGGEGGEVEVAAGEGVVDQLADQVDQLAAVAREVPGEVALGAAEDEDRARHGGEHGTISAGGARRAAGGRWGPARRRGRRGRAGRRSHR